MRVGAHPPSLPPGQDLRNLHRDLLGGTRDLDDLPNRADLEALRDLEVDPPQRQIHRRLPADVRAAVSSPVDEVHAVVLEPGGVGNAVTIQRGQVLPGLAMQVQLYRHRGATGLVHDAQAHAASGRSDRLQRAGVRFALQRGDGNGLAARETEARVRMGRVLHQHLVRGLFRRHVVLTPCPAIGGIDRPGRGRDHLPQVELHLREQAFGVKAGLETLARREGEHGLPARPPPKRILRGIAGGDAEEQQVAFAGLEADGSDGLAGLWVLPGEEPVHPGGEVGR